MIYQFPNGDVYRIRKSISSPGAVLEKIDSIGGYPEWVIECESYKDAKIMLCDLLGYSTFALWKLEQFQKR